MKQLIVLSVIIGGLGCSAPKSTLPPPQPPSESTPVKMYEGYKQHFKFIDHELVVYQIIEHSRSNVLTLTKIKVDNTAEMNMKSTWNFTINSNPYTAERSSGFSKEEELLFSNLNFEEKESYDFNILQHIDNMNLSNSYYLNICQKMWEKLDVTKDLKSKRDTFYFLVRNMANYHLSQVLSWDFHNNSLKLIENLSDLEKFGITSKGNLLSVLTNFYNKFEKEHKKNVFIDIQDIGQSCYLNWWTYGNNKEKTLFGNYLHEIILNPGNQINEEFKKTDDNFSNYNIKLYEKHKLNLFRYSFLESLNWDFSESKEISEKLKNSAIYKSLRNGVNNVIKK